jgi:saccharopine dehydrogenase-like NADP-dependent oxidoreductase
LPTGFRAAQVTVVSHLPQEAMNIAQAAHSGLATPRVLSVGGGEESAELDALIQEADVVVSLLPPPFHPQIAKRCVEVGTRAARARLYTQTSFLPSHSLPSQLGTHMVTASYVSDGMRALDAAAKAKGVVLFNEMGLDPGMDHMSAMRVIDTARAKGAAVTAFR